MQLIMSKIKYLVAVVFLCWSYGTFAQQIKGELKDDAGKFVNAHGAGVLYHNGTWYLFGEIKKGRPGSCPGSNGRIIAFRLEEYPVTLPKT
jgi:hypothetical protein